jgi:hypothetical protein
LVAADERSEFGREIDPRRSECWFLGSTLEQVNQGIDVAAPSTIEQLYRASAAKPDLTFSDDDVLAIAEICRASMDCRSRSNLPQRG